MKITTTVLASFLILPSAHAQEDNPSADIFPTDDYDPEINRPHDFPFPETPPQSNAMFARAGRMLNEVFPHANALGIKTCVGTEGPLKIPLVVKERLEGLGLDPNDPAVVQRLYEGMFLRIKRTFPIDYYWLWGHAGEVGVPGFLADVQSMVGGHATARAPFDLAICGWGWMADLEYYIQAETNEGGTLDWPVTSPDLNQTVVVLTSSH